MRNNNFNMSSSSESTVCSGIYVPAPNTLHPHLEDLKRTIEELVLSKVMSTWYKIQDLNTTYQNGLVFTRAQRAVARRYKRELEVNHVAELATDEVLLHAMLLKEWRQLEKISSAESFTIIQIPELTHWINEWQDLVGVLIVGARHERFLY